MIYETLKLVSFHLGLSPSSGTTDGRQLFEKTDFTFLDVIFLLNNISRET